MALSINAHSFMMRDLDDLILPTDGQKSMSIDAELTKCMLESKFSFMERAIARELLSLLTESKTIGSHHLVTNQWADEWMVEEAIIWKVIQAIEIKGIWEVVSGMDGDLLVSKAIGGAAKSISKAKKNASLKAIKNRSCTERATDLTLSDANIAHRSMFAEVVQTIPFEDRFTALRKPYDGWLPCATYTASGMVYRPDAALIDRLRREHPALDMELAFALMYEDLRDAKRDRPSMDAFGYWIRNWLKSNTERLIVAADATAHSAAIDSLLEQY